MPVQLASADAVNALVHLLDEVKPIALLHYPRAAVDLGLSESSDERPQSSCPYKGIF